MYRRMSWGGAAHHLRVGCYVTQQGRRPQHSRDVVPSLPAQHWGPAPPGPEDTHHVEHICHEHLHIHAQGRAPVAGNLDGFMNFQG